MRTRFSCASRGTETTPIAWKKDELARLARELPELLYDPSATTEALAVAENAFGVRLPQQIAELLLDSNGVGTPATAVGRSRRFGLGALLGNPVVRGIEEPFKV